MKIRAGFVSNSSSTAYMMTNLTNKVKTLIDFVNETPELIENFLIDYGEGTTREYRKELTQENLLASAQKRIEEKPDAYTWLPHEAKYTVFGDEEGDLIGRVYDYMLRGEDLSEQAKIIEEFSKKKREDITQKDIERFEQVLNHSEDCFAGVESKSFKVEFEEWLR